MADGSNNSPSTLEINSGFLELESMASMQRLGDSAAPFAAGGSTLLDIDAAQRAKVAANTARDDLKHGHHESERYSVLSEIARGGMGAILEVQDADLDRRVAMKVLLRDTRKTGTGSGSGNGSDSKVSTGPVERFIAEAQLTGSLEHPNIVPVHELGLDAQGRVYFTMKRVRGKSLRAVLDKLRQGHEGTLADFTQARLLNTLLKVCDAIEFAHSKGIVHRDLKPENIMVGEFGEVLVMDWGLAKQIGAADIGGFSLGVSLGASDEDSTQTREGTVSGTPAYMSPEQARGNISQIDARTDVFCLGAMLYEMLCLVPPFISSSMTSALEQARTHSLMQPRAKLDSVLADKDLKRAFSQQGLERARRHPRELVAVAMKAMNERRERRYQSVRDFKRDIENFQGALPVSAHKDHVFARMAKWGRRNPTRTAVWALIILVTLAGLGMASAVQAKFAMEQAEAQQTQLSLERDKASEADRRLKAETVAREAADKSARLEKEKAESERREAAKLNARRAALVPYSKAADLRTRAATNASYAMRAKSWSQAADFYSQALALDPNFAQAHLELGEVYADLGYDDEALLHFERADTLTAAETGRGHVEALMAWAMYDFQRKLLNDSIGENFGEIFRRFGPVKEAAEPGSMYSRLAQLLVDLGESYRTSDRATFLRDLDQFADDLRKLESENQGPALWETYALLAMFDWKGGTQAKGMRAVARRKGNYLAKARELKPNLPLLAWLDARYASESEGKHKVDAWNEFCKQFPYDPRGFYSRALLVYSTLTEEAKAAVADLKVALALYPPYQDAHKLLLAISVREGHLTQATEHIRQMRQSLQGDDRLNVDLMEVELTARIGDYDRLETLVCGMMLSSRPQGLKALATAARILLGDAEYSEVVELCDRALEQSDTAACRLFRARAHMMLGRFEEAQTAFDALSMAPEDLGDEWRAQLSLWSEQCLRLPALFNSTNLTDARDRLDLARILAVSGAKPDRWLYLFAADGPVAARLGKNVQEGDFILQAVGHTKLAATQKGDAAAKSRQRAVECLASAFEAGYLNRARIKSDALLSPLTSDPAIARYFVTQ
jgi:serine/threonine protein kinase